MKTMTLLAALLAVTLGAGCNRGRAKVEVNCNENAAGDVDCVVSHLEGDMKAKLCWDFVITCENREKATGSGCATVAKGEKTNQIIARKDFKNIDKCDKLKSNEVTNMKVTKAK